MARTRTLLQLRTEIRNRGDLLSVRHSDAELTRNINQSIAELYDLLVDFNKDYFLSSDDITVVSGTDTYSLPADFYKVLGVDVQDGGKWRNLRRFNWAERNQLQEGAGGKLATRYRAMGSNLRLRPTPDWGGTVRFWYIPAPGELSADGDTFDGIAGWEEYIVVDGIMKAKVKDEESVSETFELKQQLIKRIRAQSHDRDDGEPDRIRDVESESDGWRFPSYLVP